MSHLPTPLNSAQAAEAAQEEVNAKAAVAVVNAISDMGLSNDVLRKVVAMLSAKLKETMLPKLGYYQRVPPPHSLAEKFAFLFALAHGALLQVLSTTPEYYLKSLIEFAEALVIAHQCCHNENDDVTEAVNCARGILLRFRDLLNVLDAEDNFSQDLFELVEACRDELRCVYDYAAEEFGYDARKD